MADDNKPTKYARYAIGEIILVVIGILIALQINNWNESRKSKKFEKEILFLIDQNLSNDSIVVHKELHRAKQAIYWTDKLLIKVAEKEYGDSINQWLGHIITFERFHSQSSAFEVLKEKGIETISSKELQMALISYYDDHLFRTYQSLNDVEQSFKVDWIPVVKERFAEFNWRKYHVPVDAEVFFEDPSSIVLFRIYRDNRLGSIEMLKKFRAKDFKYKILDKRISQELSYLKI